jgi:hypothetical protein
MIPQESRYGVWLLGSLEVCGRVCRQHQRIHTPQERSIVRMEATRFAEYMLAPWLRGGGVQLDEGGREGRDCVQLLFHAVDASTSAGTWRGRAAPPGRTRRYRSRRP